MRDGFIKAAAATPVIKLGDCTANAETIIKMIDEAEEAGVKILCFPEMCITGYTIGDLVLQDILLNNAREAVLRIARSTAGKDIFAVVGFPFQVNSKLYICAAALNNGHVLGIVPKHFLPCYAEYYESRHFMRGTRDVRFVDLGGEKVPFGMNIIFENKEVPYLKVGIEICEDLWMPQPPSGAHAVAGATIILNPSASDELAGKRAYRRELVKQQSARLICGYLYADAGEGESTTDLCFSGHDLIVENGVILEESAMFSNGLTISEIDVNRLVNERRRMTSYSSHVDGYERVEFTFTSVSRSMAQAAGDGEMSGKASLPETPLTRKFAMNPFIPENEEERKGQFREVVEIQAWGLASRLKAINCKQAIIGISGGLDSTLAVLVTVEAFKKLGLDMSGIVAVTMPCFGTSVRTRRNAEVLIEELGIRLEEINIKDAVNGHLSDIGHDGVTADVTFENAQARERTQILMDMANLKGGIVVGTGDLSELALGFATYNGDHMSMYGVNASVPKTLVRALVEYFAQEAESERLRDTLLDIIGTPVSPELLPSIDGLTSQITEDIVGPYELHDFFIFYMIRYGFEPAKIFRMAKEAFKGRYDAATILKWQKQLYRRFFNNQFKRSCLPDGPKTGSVALSPRGDWRMPSDIKSTAWMAQLDSIEA
ncbi:MAG: NAD(+) synthase [Lachnospiraceae bacterium]|nr:NAD(+) synthase [Lachnospiraceae bacterium]